jgi:hypothetical protein
MQTTIREEQILNKTATFTPLTKDEIFLQEVVSGGGDSDFSTAEVTITDSLHFYPVEGDNIVVVSTYTEPIIEGVDYIYGTSTVVLYKGEVWVAPDEQYELSELSVSGDAEIVDGCVRIYGDCTISGQLPK